MEHYLMISDAAKEVCVESHVLRYWEEELKLPIKRNEQGHRYYTQEDVERFKQIKRMKEKGLQLKAIKLVLKDGNMNLLAAERASVRIVKPEGMGNRENMMNPKKTIRQDKVEKDLEGEQEATMGISIISSSEISKEDKAKRLQWLLRQLIRETLQENNDALCNEIRNSIVKELDYQFRNLEEREEERELQRINRDEAYYKKMDELLRKKSRGDVVTRKMDKTERSKERVCFAFFMVFPSVFYFSERDKIA